MHSAATRGFEFDLQDGDTLALSLLIPDAEPESLLPTAELPELEVIRPDGSVLRVSADQRTIFDEPFSGTRYITLADLRSPAAMGGRYQVTIFGTAPARFSVALGTREIFGTRVDRVADRPAGVREATAPVQTWFTTAPAPAPTPTPTPKDGPPPQRSSADLRQDPGPPEPASTGSEPAPTAAQPANVAESPNATAVSELAAEAPDQSDLSPMPSPGVVSPPVSGTVAHGTNTRALTLAGTALAAVASVGLLFWIRRRP